MNEFILAMIRGLIEQASIETVVTGRSLYKRFEDYAKGQSVELDSVLGVPIRKSKLLGPNDIHLYQVNGHIIKASFPT